ncbi:MAG: lectin [Alphaproteobacteria bacterium]|nr:lectin [Alphaproteobacteria bacterium]
MTRMVLRSLLMAGAVAGICGAAVAVHAQAANTMSFFITSAPKGDGANYGGLAGADAYCTSLAKAAGSAKTQWRAYLSATAVAAANGQPAQAPVDARDRIGAGPWYNAKGELVASNVDDLHSRTLTKDLLLTEKGTTNNGMGDKPNMHDILTGSDSAGRYLATGGDTTCKNWTSNSDGSAMLGHFDGRGPNANRNYTSWNSAHMSRSCSQPDLVATGGAGQLYCFAAD